MAASFEGHTDIVQTLIEAKAQINTQKEVCCSYHQKTHTITHSVTVYSCTRWGDCVFVSTGWLDCSSRGSSWRQSWCGETTDWSSGSGQHTDWGIEVLFFMRWHHHDTIITEGGQTHWHGQIQRSLWDCWNPTENGGGGQQLTCVHCLPPFQEAETRMNWKVTEQSV